MVENGVFELGRQRVGEGLDGRLDVEGDQRREQRLDLGAGQRGNVAFEVEREPRAGGFAGRRPARRDLS